MARLFTGLTMFRTEIPYGVKMVAVLYFVVAGCALFFGVLLTCLNIIRAKIPFSTGTHIQYGFDDYVSIIKVIFLIGLAIFSFFIVKGLLKTQNWARNAVIILTGLWIIIAAYIILASLGIIGIGGIQFYDWVSIGMILMLYGSVFVLPFNIAIISYLMFNRKVKVAFLYFIIERTPDESGG